MRNRSKRRHRSCTVTRCRSPVDEGALPNATDYVGGDHSITLGMCGNCEDGLSDDNHFCYKAQCYETKKLIASQLALSKDLYSVSFQSRLNDKWIKPYTDKVMLELVESNHKKV